MPIINVTCRFFDSISKTISVVFVVSLLTGCNGFFGSKTDTSFISIPDFSVKAVAYVPIQPIITGFSKPSDICIGYDRLIYVVDEGTEEVICFDESMVRLSSIKIRGASKIAQDRKLNLLVLGKIDTTINTIKYTLACIYKLDLKNSTYGLSSAVVVNKIIHPFYINNSIKNSDTDVVFTGIGTLADNSYYISRAGRSQNNLLGGPDDAILFFSDNNVYQYFLQVSTSDLGVVSDFIKSPVSLASFVQPPQSNSIRDVKDLIFVSNNPAEALKVKVLTYSIVEDAPVFSLNQDLVVGDTSKASGFLYTPRKFSTPSDVTFSGDGTQLIFITDSQKDSLFVFSNTGLEGINPPAGSTSKKNIKVSFGGSGQGLKQFNAPTAVAYYNKIVLVADAGNQRILRFKLTTDLR